MTRLRIIYNKQKCIGNGACAREAPLIFNLKENRSILIGGKKRNDLFVLEGNFNVKQKKAVISAAHLCPVNAISLEDVKTKSEIIGERLLKHKNYKEIHPDYDDSKDFIVDSSGYFLIKVNEKNKSIEVLFCRKKNEIMFKITGKTPIELYQTMINKEKLNIRKDHCAYLGRELQKAYDCLKNNKEYVQDSEG